MAILVADGEARPEEIAREEMFNRWRRLWRDPRQPSESVQSAFSGSCLECGACCLIYATRPFLIPLFESDAPPSKLVQIGPRLSTHGPEPDWDTNRYMRIDRQSARAKDGAIYDYGKCIALDFVPGKRVGCKIYEERPRCCSEFAPGSPACVRARDWVRLSPPEDVMALGRS